MHDLVHVRNAIQHALCTLRQNLSPVNLSEALQEANRATLLCFSDMVIFPIPEQTGLRSRLITGLYTSLRVCDQFEAWQAYRLFMLWATMIGGIAAVSIPPLRAAFSDLLRDNLRTQFVAWEDLKNHFLGFIWWDYICEDSGRLVYTEATMLTAF